MEQMTFTVDKTVVTEGDIVEVRWDCPGADNADLTIDNGYKTTTLPLPLSGNKRFRLHRSKGRTQLVITAMVDGKRYSKTQKVKVKEIPVTKAETVDCRGKRIGKLRQWMSLPKWQMWKSRFRQGWQMMPPEKRLASRLLLILGGVLLLATFFPALLLIGLFGLSMYLMWILMRR
jgi:hypothetical protein